MYKKIRFHREEMHLLKNLGRVFLKFVNPNVDLNVDVDVTYVNFAYKNIWMGLRLRLRLRFTTFSKTRPWSHWESQNTYGAFLLFARHPRGHSAQEEIWRHKVGLLHREPYLLWGWLHQYESTQWYANQFFKVQVFFAYNF